MNNFPAVVASFFFGCSLLKEVKACGKLQEVSEMIQGGNQISSLQN